MKTENLIMLALAGFALWYFTTQTAAAKTPMQKLVDTEKIQTSFDAVRAARAKAIAESPLIQRQTGSF